MAVRIKKLLQRSELNLQTKIISYLKTIPDLFYFKCSDRVMSGLPDLIICYKGRFIAAEIKKPGLIKIPTQNDKMPGLESRLSRFSGARKLQAYTLDKIENSGGVAGVFDSLESFKSFILNLTVPR